MITYKPGPTEPDDLVAGQRYWAELPAAQVNLGVFQYQSGEGFLYFENGNFMSAVGIRFYELTIGT